MDKIDRPRPNDRIVLQQLVHQFAIFRQLAYRTLVQELEHQVHH
jgi:hypothetical protein